MSQELQINGLHICLPDIHIYIYKDIYIVIYYVNIYKAQYK